MTLVTPAPKPDQSANKTSPDCTYDRVDNTYDSESAVRQKRSRNWRSSIFGTVVIMMGVLVGLGLLLAVHRQSLTTYQINISS
ncbi:hypothetical protein MGN70_012172 [Eutypa lata]|nr:hypothetical protein MGN70_012172 [Eutypa lata]